MSKRTIIILIIVGLIIVGLAVALLLTDESFFQKPAPEANTNVNEQAVEPSGQGLPLVDTIAPERPPLTSVEQTVYFTARNFSERYASFSSDSNFQNITELEGLTTSALFARLASTQAEAMGTGFYSVSSKALKVDILRVDEAEGSANVLVSLQRREVKNSASEFIFNQNLELVLSKSGDNWLVSEANWQ